MAVNATPPLPKSQPDIGKLNGFTGTPTITVTKHLGPRNTVGQSVVPTQPMALPQILDLMTKLPVTYGPGYYFFTASDSGGSGDDTWMVRLGPDQPQQENAMAGPGFPTPPGSQPPTFGPTPEGLQQIGRGYFYNETLGTLSTPWGTLVEWRPGQTLPQPPTNTPHLSLVPPNASPSQWGAPGWGSIPVDDNRALKEMEARLAAEERRREREDAERRRQEEREEARREREEQRRRDEERDRRTEKLFELLTARPQGPNEETLALRREIEENRRRLEERERDDIRRREDQAREERYRADMQAQREKSDTLLREVRESKPDPMLSVLTSLMSSTQSQAAESVRAVREAATMSAQAAERHTGQIMEAMGRDKTGAAEMTRTTLETTRNLMEMQSQMFQQAIEMQSRGDQPWYATAIQGAIEKVGAVAAAVSAKNEAAAAQPQYAPPRTAGPRVAAPGTTRPIPAVASPPPPVGLPTRADTGERPEGVEYDTTSETFVIPGGPGHPGYRVPAGYVQQHGWTETLKLLARQSAPSPVESFMAPPPAAAPPLPAAAPAPAAMNGAAGHAKPPKKGGKKGTAAVAPVPVTPEPGPIIPPPADAQRGYNRDELRGFEYDVMFKIVEPFDDPTFFGDLWPYVQQLRGTPTTPARVAEYVMQGRAQLSAAGKSVPATDVLEAEQLDVLVDRLFPGAADDYTEAVVKALASAMGLEMLEEVEG